MFSYTIEEARKIVMKCAKEYDAHLVNRRFIIIYRERTNNTIKFLELYFGKENFQHLTGVELVDKEGNVREHVAELFYDKCLKNKLAKAEIRFKKDGTTNLKLAALPIMMQIHKVTKIAGGYNKSRPYLIADQLVGNVNFCLGLIRDVNNNYYVPASALLEDIKKLTTEQSQVLAILSKDNSESVYKKICHVAKGLNLNNLKIPDEIMGLISL